MMSIADFFIIILMFIAPSVTLIVMGVYSFYYISRRSGIPLTIAGVLIMLLLKMFDVISSTYGWTLDPYKLLALGLLMLANFVTILVAGAIGLIFLIKDRSPKS